jgi:hypothetical protein
MQNNLRYDVELTAESTSATEVEHWRIRQRQEQITDIIKRCRPESFQLERQSPNLRKPAGAESRVVDREKHTVTATWGTGMAFPITRWRSMKAIIGSVVSGLTGRFARVRHQHRKDHEKLPAVGDTDDVFYDKLETHLRQWRRWQISVFEQKIRPHWNLHA